MRWKAKVMVGEILQARKKIIKKSIRYLGKKLR
jgi:hypothetical protein